MTKDDRACMTDREALIEAMAKAMFEAHPAYTDTSETRTRIRFEDVIFSNGPYWREKASAALSAIEAAGGYAPEGYRLVKFVEKVRPPLVYEDDTQ